jgi:hypothetical protein
VPLPLAFRLLSNATGVSILGNSIYSNVSVGIDLTDNNIVELNDVGDADTGANNLQNFPVLTSAVYNGSDTVISGSLNSNANTTYRIEFYSQHAWDRGCNWLRRR